ncbi:hypothetical protein [uncultured Tenacibaculum sp.]|uniref:hypothetical protein n=1 Tax=uncultured Tenacibaculum sp. TaxID=174713 RepID=UPI00262063AD|nr:hypothetical protein [uncultured Tenacibaculum sp.]
MKKLTLVVIGLLLSFNLFSQQVNIKYNPNNHSLTGTLNKVPISKLIDALSKQDLNLFIVGDNRNFNVNGQLSNTPVDAALSKIIPSKVKYFYKVDSKQGERNRIAKTSQVKKLTLIRPQLITFKQSGDKNATKDTNKPQLNTAKKLISLKNINILKTSKKVKDPVQPKNIKFRGSTQMSTVRRIKPVLQSRVRKIDLQVPNLLLSKRKKSGKKHLVVTYKITQNGITPISKAEEDGDYKLSTETSGDWGIIGLEGDNAVIAETFENPLSYRTIFDPERSDHKEFTAKEAYVTVKMPLKFKSKVTSKKLDLKLVKFKDFSKATNLLQKVKNKQLRKSELNRSFQILRTAPKVDFTKLRTTN